MCTDKDERKRNQQLNDSVLTAKTCCRFGIDVLPFVVLLHRIVAIFVNHFWFIIHTSFMRRTNN